MPALRPTTVADKIANFFSGNLTRHCCCEKTCVERDIEIIFACDRTGGLQPPDARALAVGVAIIGQCSDHTHTWVAQIDFDQHTGDGTRQTDAFNAVRRTWDADRAGILNGRGHRNGPRSRQ